MTTLIEVARQIVELDQKQFTDGDLYAEYDQQYQNRSSGKTALASAFIESQEALGEALKLLDQCAEACERSYNVNDWPADGDTIQDHAASAARAFLSKHKDKDNG